MVAARTIIRSIAARMKRLFRVLPLRLVVYSVTEYVFVLPYRLPNSGDYTQKKRRNLYLLPVLPFEASRIAH